MLATAVGVIGHGMVLIPAAPVQPCRESDNP